MYTLYRQRASWLVGVVYHASALLIGSANAGHASRMPVPNAPAHAAPVAFVAHARVDERPLAGRWLMTLREPEGVELLVRMTLETRDRNGQLTWEGYSRPGAAREMVGSATAVLGRALGKMPPREALLHIADGTGIWRGDTLQLTGILDSPFLGRRTVTGTLVGGRFRSDLARLPNGAPAGTLEGVPDTSARPIRDYRALADDIEQGITGIIYDPALPQRPEFTRFFTALRERLGRAGDDLDAIASFQALKPRLGISHIDIIRNPTVADLATKNAIVIANAASDPDKLVTLSFPAPGVAFLRVTRWDRVGGAIDRAFARIDSARSTTLLLDIRANPGGDATSMIPLAHLLRDTVDIGVFLGRRWYQTHRSPPSAGQLRDLPTLTTDQAPEQLIYDVRTQGAVVGRVAPRMPHFDGSVFLLADQRTASASEPLAHAIKSTRRGTLVGERTAGAMLTALPHALREGWILIVPEADFIAADGQRLEGAGVEPDVSVPSNEVFLAVADRLMRTTPFAASVLRAGSLVSLRRTADAERAYRDAIRLAAEVSPTPSPTSLAFVHKRLAALLTARGDLASARAEYEAVLRLVPGDVEAQAGVRRR